MKRTLTVACISLKSVWQAVSLRSALAALLLAPLAALCADDSKPSGVRLNNFELPVVLANPGAEFQDDARPGAMIIGMDRTPKGRIWGCWTGTGDKRDGYFLLATSDDDGATWSKPRLAVGARTDASQQLSGALVGNLWTDPKGRLWLFFDQQRGDPKKRITNWFMRCDDPDAAEPVWSTPVMFAEGCTLNKPTVLKDGARLLPVSDWHRKTARVFASTDDGASWQERGSLQFPDWQFDEHMMVELKDGRLWMLARTKGQPHESFSSDGGKTWSAPQQAATVQNINARFFLRRLKSGRILLVKNGPVNVRLPRRSSMTAFLSDDDGKSWSKGLLLDDRAEVSYPDGFEAPDGLIHILYDWNRHTDAEILMAKFREEDVLAGKIVSKDVKLRMLANKALAPHLPKPITPDPKWTAQGIEDAKQDFRSIPYDGVTPNKMVCDTTLRELPDGSWILFMLAGGDTEPSPLNYTGVTRSFDKGKTWSKPREVPGRLKNRTFIRKHIVCKDGRIMIPFQHYIGPDDEQDKAPLDRSFTNPRNGVLISSDGGGTWTEHGNIRLTPNDRYFAVVGGEVGEDNRLLFLGALADDALAQGKGPIRVLPPWVTVAADEAEALSRFIQQEEGPAQSLQHGDELRHEAPREFVGGVGGLEEAGDFGEDGLVVALRFALVGGAAVGLEGARDLANFGLALLVGNSDALFVGEKVAEAFIERGERVDDAFAVKQEERTDGGGYAFKFGLRGGSLMASMPAPCRIWSKPSVNLVSRSWIK